MEKVENTKNYSNTKLGNEISFKRQLHLSFLPECGEPVLQLLGDSR